MTDDIVDKNKPIARVVVYDHTPKVRTQFDEALKTEIQEVCDAVDDALKASFETDDQLLHLAGDRQFQVAHALGACRKAINDILGSLESLRSGYLDHAQALMRLVDEGLATAAMVAHNMDICKAYAEDRYSVNDSVHKMRRHWDELGIPKELAQEFEDAYKGRHKSAHPTFASIGLSFDFKGKKGIPIGGAYHEDEMKFYRATLGNLAVSAKNLAGFQWAKLLSR